MSKGTLGTFVGGAIGFVVSGFNPVGAQFGAMIGGAIGSSFDTIPGRKVGEMSSPQAKEGEPIPLVYGSARVMGRLMLVGEPDIRKSKDSGKGGPKVENETAYLSYSILVCESSELRDSTIDDLLIVYQNNKIVYDMRPVPAIPAADSAKWKQNKTFYFGGEAQTADPTEQMIHGAGSTPAYRGICRMVVTDEDVTQHGGSIPAYEFVTTACGIDRVETSPWRWLGTGQTSAGTRASIRPMSWALEWVGTADTEVTPTNTTANGAVTRYGDKMFAIIKNNDCRVADVSSITAWGAGPTGLNLGTMPLAHTSVFGGRLWVACGDQGISYLSSAADASFTTITNMLPLITPFKRSVKAVTGNGSNVLCMDGYGAFYKSSDSGGTWGAGADLFGGVNRFYTAYGALESNGNRAVVAGGETALRAAYTDNNGASFTQCTVPAAPGLGNQVKYCGNDRWLIACRDATTASNGLFKSTDNGATFTAVTLPHVVQFSHQSKQNIAVDSLTGRVVIAGGEVGTGTARFYYSDDLDNWLPIDMTGTSVSGITEVYPIGATAVYPGTELPDVPGHYYDPETGEVTGPAYVANDCPGVSLSDIIDRLDARAGIPPANSVTTALDGIIVPGYAIDSFMTVADAKEQLRRVYFFDCPEYDDAIRYRLRGGATDFTVNPDDLIVGEDATEKGIRGQTVEFPKRLHVQYSDPVTGYKPMKQTAERISPDIRVKGEEVVSANITLEADTAKQAADIGLKTAWTAREDSREIVLPMDYLKAVPSDCYSLDGRRYRITDLRIEAGAIYIQSEYDRISAYSSNAVGEVGQSPTGYSNLSGPTLFAAMNIPVLRDADDKPGIYLAAAGVLPTWRGARIDLSRDGGTSYATSIIPDMTQSAVMGVLTDSLPLASGVDATNTIHVRIDSRDTTLDTLTLAQLLNEGNPAAIMKADGTAEIVQFQNALEVSPGVYELTTLIRNRLDTTPAAHAAGAQFVLLNSAIRFMQVSVGDIGKTLTLRPVSIGTDPALNPSYSIPLATMESQREWQPYNVTVTKQAGCEWLVDYVQRPRLGTDANPIQSQWWVGDRINFTVAGVTKSRMVTTPPFLYTAAMQVEDFGAVNCGGYTVTVAAVNEYTGSDGAGGTGGGTGAGDQYPNFPLTITGSPSGGYVGEPIFDALGPTFGGPFKAYGGKTEERFSGEIVGNVTCQSSAPGSGVMIGIPLTAETRNAATEIIPTGPDISGGPFLITDSVTIAAKPTYSMMDEFKAFGEKALITPVTTPPRTTKQISSIGLGGLKSRAGASAGKVRCAFTVGGMPAGGRVFVGVLAAGETAHLAPGTGGSFAHMVTADGVFVVELDAATGAVEVFEIGVGSVATGTLPLTYAYDGKYRFAWVANDAQHKAAGAAIHVNMGNEPWPDTPTAGFGGLPNEASIVPCGFDAAVGSANGYWLQGAASLTEATRGGISGSSLVYAYAAFGKSTGKWRVGMAGLSTGRLGFCKAGHTGLLGASGTADSIGFTDTRSLEGYIIETSFGGVFNRITIPAFFYYSNPLVYFAFDADAHTLAIYVKVEVIAGDPSAVYQLLTTLTGIPSGTWLPAVNGAAQLVPEIPEPATFNNWTITL